MKSSVLHLFDAFGVELEYMLVDRETSAVRPVADQLLTLLSGEKICSDYAAGPVTWSNELALHVVELKTTLPAPDLRDLPAQFRTAIADLQPALDKLNVRLLPTAMHPWMEPALETVLWPHENSEIYAAYHRIFDCRSHGWANVQSVHLNLPFSGDAEFARLHAATRLVLPILPAIAASSPIVAGRLTGSLSSRIDHYANHCRVVPSLIGELIPEPIYDETTYRREIFDPIRRDMSPLDRDGVFELDFLNSRGAIARFDRGSIELRVMDVQEYPAADVAICAAATALIRGLVNETWGSLEFQKSMPTSPLRNILNATAKDAENARVECGQYLNCFGIETSSCTAGELWSTLLQQLRRDDPALDTLYGPLELIQRQGTLATRICQSLGTEFGDDQLHRVYIRLSECLTSWKSFRP